MIKEDVKKRLEGKYRLKYLLCQWINDEKMFTITFTDSEENFETNLPTFNEILNSIKLTKQWFKINSKNEIEPLNNTGFHIGTNCGESAGQTIFHAHLHFIQRRDGDTSSPRDGVRGVIPDKMDY